MHAAFLTVTFSDGDEATQILAQQVIPQASAAPGWSPATGRARCGRAGRGWPCSCSRAEDAAQAFTSEIPREPGGGVEGVDDLFIAPVVGRT